MDTESADLTSPLVGIQDEGEEARTAPTPSTADDIKAEIAKLTAKLAKALPLPTNESGVDKDGGYADLDFVKTKPGLTAIFKRKSSSVKTILHEFRAEFPEGCVTALMGPSGAGKTTLLDFLTGMLGRGVHASGKVSLPDDDAYVPQDDRLHNFFTCQAYMEHYARLTGKSPILDCCKPNLQGEEDILGFEDVGAQIDRILSDVGLSDQKNTPVGGLFKRGLSGGQKRRLSVALEALSSPINLFLDEPTSGLDSESALGLMKYLRSYAQGRHSTGRRRRVIVTIHQPSTQIWELIDNVVLLAKGRLMYQGKRKDMDTYFAACGWPVPTQYNPADHFIEALSSAPKIGGERESEDDDLTDKLSKDEVAEMWSCAYKRFRQGEVSQKIRDERDRRRNLTRSSGFTMLVRKSSDVDNRAFERINRLANSSARTAFELVRRSFTSLLKNPIVFLLRVAIYGGMSLLTGVLFWNLEGRRDTHSVLVSRTGLLYFIIAFCSSMSVVAIPFAMIDRAIREKEVRNHLYHPAWNHASQALASLPVQLLLCIIVSVIVLKMTNISPGSDDRFWFILNLFLCFSCADATSMLTSHVAPDMISAICISSGIFGQFTMVMGFLVLPGAMPGALRWLYDVPFMTYSFRSLMYLEYNGMTVNVTNSSSSGFMQGEDVLGDVIFEAMAEHPVQAGNMILKFFKMTDVHVGRDMGVLAIWYFAANIVSVLYLCWGHWRNRRVFVYSD